MGQGQLRQRVQGGQGGGEVGVDLRKERNFRFKSNSKFKTESKNRRRQSEKSRRTEIRKVDIEENETF